MRFGPTCNPTLKHVNLVSKHGLNMSFILVSSSKNSLNQRVDVYIVKFLDKVRGPGPSPQFLKNHLRDEFQAHNLIKNSFENDFQMTFQN